MSEIRLRRKFVARHASQGPDRIIIVVPKEHQESVKKLRNPMLVTVEEIL